jgi:hypothetical protein
MPRTPSQRVNSRLAWQGSRFAVQVDDVVFPGELVLAPAQAVVDAHRPRHRDGTAALALGALGEHAAATGALAAGVLAGQGRDGESEKVR